MTRSWKQKGFLQSGSQRIAMAIVLGQALLLSLSNASIASAAERKVPGDHATIQAAIDASAAGDSVVVSAGRYVERLRLKPGVTVRSAGDDSVGRLGLKRAEATIVDGGGDVASEGETGGAAADADKARPERAKRPGVVMAEGSRLDGLTITNVGRFDQAVWDKHRATHGEELGDDEGATKAEGTVAAVWIPGVECEVIRCIVRENGDVGIGVVGREGAKVAALVADNHALKNMGGGIGIALGAEPIVRRNRCSENLRAGIGCRAANPLIVDNDCVGNVRAGIGCREGSLAVIRGNRCHGNGRAGIGIRMQGTAPFVEKNECRDNEMAGIGCRDGASPLIARNQCRKNKLAGIGCRDGASPTIVGNECRENGEAGIGLDHEVVAKVVDNRCIDNAKVALGVTGGSTATVVNNEFARQAGGAPPIVAIKDGSTASLHGNRIRGGGVAAILVQGRATIDDNELQGEGPKQGNAIWIWEKSSATVVNNRVADYRSAVVAAKSAVTVVHNRITRYQSVGISIKDAPEPPVVHANTGDSPLPTARLVEVTGGVDARVPPAETSPSRP